MGELSVNTISTSKERDHFIKYLLNDIRALEMMVEQDLIEKDITRIGSEQELCLVDNHWRPAPVALELLAKINDPHFTTELALFNMEINLDPIILEGNCFQTLKQDLKNWLDIAENAAQSQDTKVLLTGILPTIKHKHINLQYMTPKDRYFALAESMKMRRKGEFEFHISGTDELITRHDSVMFESCNTSFQMHYQVSPEKFVDTYNWAQIISGPVLASSTNSPLLLSKRLWRETRIALFQQSLDTRNSLDPRREKLPRVTFGNHWIKDSIVDIYKEDIMRFEPLLGKTLKSPHSLHTLENGKIPLLEALRLHNSTIYKWNRPCFGISDNGKPHLRIENRYLASGPSITDEIANMVFWTGLMSNVPQDINQITKKLDFDDVKTNFLKAAKLGLENRFKWFHNRKYSASELIQNELIPMAREGLIKKGVNTKDVDYYLEVILCRVGTGRTGSQWLLDSYNINRKRSSNDEALITATAGIYKRQQQNLPVCKWALPALQEAGNWSTYYHTIEQIMSTDVLTVKEDDMLDLVASIMDWKQVRHVPVENEAGKLVGLVTAGLVVHFLSKRGKERKLKTRISDFMFTKLEMCCVSPETTISEAIQKMKQYNMSCLTVIKDDKLVGIVTEKDFVNVSAKLLKEIHNQRS
jgi:CBS domain-containing protein